MTAKIPADWPAFEDLISPSPSPPSSPVPRSTQETRVTHVSLGSEASGGKKDGSLVVDNALYGGRQGQAVQNPTSTQQLQLSIEQPFFSRIQETHWTQRISQETESTRSSVSSNPHTHTIPSIPSTGTSAPTSPYTSPHRSLEPAKSGQTRSSHHHEPLTPGRNPFSDSRNQASNSGKLNNQIPRPIFNPGPRLSPHFPEDHVYGGQNDQSQRVLLPSSGYGPNIYGFDASIHLPLILQYAQIDLMNSKFNENQKASAQVIRMPPPAPQPNNGSIDLLKFHGNQTSMVSRPSPGSYQQQGSIYHPPPQNHMHTSNLEGGISRPVGFNQIKWTGQAVNHSHSHSQAWPKYVPNMAPAQQPPIPNMASQSRQYVVSPSNSKGQFGHAANEQRSTASWGSQSSTKLQSTTPRGQSMSSHNQIRPSPPPFSVGDDGVARISTYSNSPSNMNVVIDPSRPFSTQKTQLMRGSQPTSSNLNGSPRSPFTSLARVEIPASTPEKLAAKPFNPSFLLETKKRGRPFMSSESAAKAALKAARKLARENGEEVEEKKKLGRPVKAIKNANVPVPEPKFMKFVCEWNDCSAELHNAETLRSHLLIVHGKRDPTAKARKLRCLWKNCFKTHKHKDEATGEVIESKETPEFETKKEWKEHLDVVHMHNVLWYQGDGPKSQDQSKPRKRTERETSPWRYNEDGKQVTPSVKNQKIDHGNPKETNAKRFKKRRDGLYVVYDLMEGPEAYKKERVFEGKEGAGGGGGGMDLG